MSTEDTEAGPTPPPQQSNTPAGPEAQGGDATPAPGDRSRRKRVRRRRVRPEPGSRDKQASVGEEQASAGEEAGAFLDPPPVESDGGAEAEKRGPRRKRKTRRRSSKKPSADSAAPAAGADEAAPGDGAEASAEAEKGTRKRRRRPRRSRAKAGDDVRADAEDPGSDRPAEVSEESTADEPAPDPNARRDAQPRAREGRRSSKKRSAKKRESNKQDAPKRDAKKRESRKRDGKRDGKRGSRRDDRRRDGRHRDPRAVDIVPRAPTPEEAAKEKILLVNAADQEEARIALLVDGVLEEIYVESSTVMRSSAGNIYRGRVQNVERGIGAAFVDLGRGLTGFLHASDVPLKEGEEPGQTVTDRLSSGDEVIVQITRDSIGRKGPALTGRISFPGRYLVLMPFTARSGISRRIPHGPDREHVRKLLRKLEVPEGMGVIVRTASEATDREALEADLEHLLRGWEFIERKAAEPGQPGLLRSESDLAERSVRNIMPSDVKRIVVDKEELAGQIHRLLRVWYPSAAAAADETAHAAVRSVAATLDTPLGELRAQAEQEAALATTPVAPPTEEAADDGGLHEEGLAAEAGAEFEAPPIEPAAPQAPASEAGPDAAQQPEEAVEETSPPETGEERLERLRCVARTMPEVELHTDAIPLFHRFNVETQLEDAFRRAIRLPSGGSIVIDPTEALVAVDVNSGRLTDEEDPESTALVTNLEAVKEAARQLRVRDLGGLVVIDFIDMSDRSSRKKVETALRDALSGDRARIRMGRMGPFGLIVLSRQRIRQALSRVTHEMCGECGGTGNRRTVSGLGLRILREMKARGARSRGRGGLEVRAPQEVIQWIRKHGAGAIKSLRKSCTGPITLQVDARLASDGWAMKGLPPSGSTGEEAGEAGEAD